MDTSKAFHRLLECLPSKVFDAHVLLVVADLWVTQKPFQNQLGAPQLLLGIALVLMQLLWTESTDTNLSSQKGLNNLLRS